MTKKFQSSVAEFYDGISIEVSWAGDRLARKNADPSLDPLDWETRNAVRPNNIIKEAFESTYMGNKQAGEKQLARYAGVLAGDMFDSSVSVGNQIGRLGKALFNTNYNPFKPGFETLLTCAFD